MPPGGAGMGDRLVRAWRAVRRPVVTPSGSVAAVAGRGDGQQRPVRWWAGRHDPSRYCGASGWQMRAGCTDGDGGTICPLCSQRVRTQPHAGVHRRVEVIEAHCA